eukprot:gene29514-35622_t
MSQTKEQVEQELQAFKSANPDWMSVEWKANSVASFNIRLASFRFKQRGVAVSTEFVDRMFEVTDEIVRVECEVFNDDKYFFASAMCDIGATTAEITLPARKIIQLGLLPFGKPHRTKGSTNDTKESLRFKPAVEVKLKFSRDGEEIEERTGLLVVNCHKDEYDQELAASTSSSVEPEVFTGAKRKASEICTDSTNRVPLSSVKLSPVVAHRPPGRPNERVVLGMAGLRKLK